METGGLPVIPGSKISNNGSWATITGFSNQFAEFRSYVVDKSPDDVINWYKSQFPDYSVENEGIVEMQGKTVASIMLRKGNTVVGVMAFEEGGNTIYFVGKTTVPEDEGASLPTRDMVFGEEPLERYPGSIMLEYSKEGEFPISYDISYGTKDPYDKVADWYRRTLQSQGWELTYQGADADTIQLDFRKDDDTVTLWIGDRVGVAYTVIEVMYTMERIPEHDLVEGEDPLPRYPGAVMVGYNESSATAQGMGMSGVRAVYLVPDNLENVREWYLNMLRERFSYVSHDRGSINAGDNTGGDIIAVQVDLIGQKKYTQVTVEYMTTKMG